MKKTALFFIVLAFAFSTFAQQVAKNYVLVELITSTGCYYCPGAEMGVQDFVDNGKNVAIIAYHHNSFGDTLYNTPGITRINFYGYEGTPDAYFNGTLNVGGGDHTTSMYSYYLPKYNSAIAVQSSFTIDLDASTNDNLNFTANVTTEKVYDYSGTNIKLFAAVTETNLPYSWQGQDHLGFVERTMAPNGSGTTLDFSSQNQISTELNFSVEPHWNLENCELVVFIQDMTTKEVLQVQKMSLDFPNGTNNVLLQSISDPNDGATLCGNQIYPTVTFKNKGTEDLTSVDFVAYMNDIVICTTSWTGNLAYAENETISLNLVEYDQLDVNELKIVAENPNGVTDDNPEDNTRTITIYKADETTTEIELELSTGSWGFEISWALYDGDGNLIEESGALASNTIYNQIISAPIDNCYEFVLYDTYGNGFNANSGYCRLYDDNNGPLLVEIIDDFGYSEEYPFKSTTPANINNVTENSYEIYPNPVVDFVNINFTEIGDYNINIFDVQGKKVVSENFVSSKNIKLNIENLDAGIYYLSVGGEKNFSEKIIVE